MSQMTTPENRHLLKIIELLQNYATRHTDYNEKCSATCKRTKTAGNSGCLLLTPPGSQYRLAAGSDMRMGAWSGWVPTVQRSRSLNRGFCFASELLLFPAYAFDLAEKSNVHLRIESAGAAPVVSNGDTSAELSLGRVFV